MERTCILCSETVIDDDWNEHPNSEKHSFELIKYYLKRNREFLIQEKKGVEFRPEGRKVKYDSVNGTCGITLKVEDCLEFCFNIKNSNDLPIELKSCHLLRKVEAVHIDDKLNISQDASNQVLASGESYYCKVSVKPTETCKMVVPIVLLFSVSDVDYIILRFILMSSYHYIEDASELMPQEPYSPQKKHKYPKKKFEIVEGVPDPNFSADYGTRYQIPDIILQWVYNNFKFPSDADDSSLQMLRDVLSSLTEGLNPDNYTVYFRTLLYLEEAQMYIDIRKYDLEGVTFKRVSRTQNLLSLQVPGLAEKRPSVIRGDKIYARISYSDGTLGEVEYEGCVHNVLDMDIWLGFDLGFLQRTYIDGMKFNVRFEVNRYPMIKCHEALLHYDDFSKLLFPKEVSSNVNLAELDTKPILYYNVDIEKNPEQKAAVENIVSGSSKPLPFLLFGPPGTGKTVTVVEAIKQIWLRNKNDAILVSAPSNSAADLLTERLLTHINKRHILRLNAPSRDWHSMSALVQGCSNHNGTNFYFPKSQQLKTYRIIISTVITAGRLLPSGLDKNYFSYIFIDEAGHCMEPETLVSFANLLRRESKTRSAGLLVLAGDPKQLGPVLRSNLAIKKGLSMSLLERLMECCDLYKSENGIYNPRVVTKLLQNYRSHPSILELPNKMFYGNELKVCGDVMLINSLCNWPFLKKKGFPFMFHGVIGKDVREKSSPSYFNVEEIDVVIAYVKKLLRPVNGIVIRPKDIGIISPYRRQVQKIRFALTKRHLDHPDLVVGSPEEFQGQERRIIIISTVRSCPDLLAMDYEHQIGFLRNPKRFNVAITRAKSLLILVGNPYILRKDYHWGKMIKYCLKNKSYSGPNLATEEEIDDVIERFAYVGIHPDMVNPVEAEKHCATISHKTNQEEPEWRWEL